MRKAAVFFALIFIASFAVAQAVSKPSAPAAKPAAAEPTAIINTTAGKMTCTLFPDKAPIGVANFIGLSTGTKDWKTPSGATKHGVPLYDGTIFHRVIPEFMIQGGDPAGTGSGPDPVKPFRNETSKDLLFDKAGRLAYANTGQPSSNSSQFFITEVPFTGQQASMLNGNYTIFGQCDEPTVELVKQIARMSRDNNDRPHRPIKITHITIQKAGGTAKPAGTTAKKPAATTKTAPATPKP